jgi:5'(3')-deoxyribonucleotidase
MSFFSSYLYILNWLVLILCFGLYLEYRIQREPFYDDPKSVPSIVVDIDGVLADQVTPVLETLNKKHGSKYIKKDIKQWDQPLPLANTDIKTAIEISHHDPEFIRNMKSIQGAPTIMRELSRYCRITIATNRADEADQPTKQWLKLNNIPYDEYHNTSVEGKGAAKGRLLIDDYPGNIENFLAAVPGRIAFIFSQPWNEQDETLIGVENVYRVSSWQEVLEKVRQLL